MRPSFAEKQTLQEAIRVLNNLTGIKVKEPKLLEVNLEIDAIITISYGSLEHVFNVELKKEVRQSQAMAIIEQFGNKKDQWLLIAIYIPQPLKEHFKSIGINYFELAGNCHIRTKEFFIFVADQKVTSARETVTGKLWKPTGLKFLMAIINNPELLQAPYREIATAAAIALGNIGPLLGELQVGGYTHKQSDVEKLVNRDKMIARWTELYHATLRPRLVKGRFRFLRPEREQDWQKLKFNDIFWGAEPGAALLTGKIRPEYFTIYTERSGNELLKLLGVVPDVNGNITVLEKFWGEMGAGKSEGKASEKGITAPALLIYADLINDLDSRNHEVAERIKKLYLNNK